MPSPTSSSSDAPLVSIVIVTWNALPLLQQCLPSVVATDYPNLEIILADNASSDGSAEWVEAMHPSVTIVRHPENWAFARGNNAALDHAEGDYVLLLNNDVEVPPDWLDPLVATMETHPDVGAVQPKLLQHHARSRFEYAGGAGGFLDRFGYPFTRGRLFFTLEEDRGQYDDPRDVFWATGAALLLRRRALDEVGLLDEQFWMHMEEIDLCWRLWRQGWRVRVEPRSTVYHIGGGSLPQGDPRKTYYNFRNSLLMLYKNLPPAAWRRVFPIRAALDGLAALRAVVQGRWAEGRAILRAYRDAHRLKEQYETTRPSSAAEAVLPSYRGSIVLDYFLRGRRHFSELPPSQFAPLPGASSS
ncbi:MAG: glycosyltransferase [Bacteroidetes bacterium]|jgi:GT2 family glycosyltransferase|nr:glycosyltransferase [Bacteroidota bacterium]